MKKTLFATTALVALGFAGAASAAEPLTASVSGYMHVGVGYSDVDPGKGDLGLMRDGEVHFNFKGSSDNGLTFDGRIELEAFTSGDQIDENWARVSGSWGWVKIGGDDHASYNLATGVFYAPGGKIGHYDDFGESNPGGTYLSNNRFSDSIGIHYNTPNWSGFQAQVSYMPAGGVDGGADRITLTKSVHGSPNDLFSVGLNYGADFDGFSLRLSAGYDYVDSGLAAGTDDDGFMLGAQVSVSGFGLGAFWKEGMEDSIGGAENEFVVNASYATGPWSFGLGWAMGDGIGGGAADVNKYAGWATYALAPGVRTSIGLEHTDGDALGDGTAGMAWMTLSF